MNSRLKLYSNEDSYGKLIEYANILRNEGYKISQIWQSEESYGNVGINFSSPERDYEYLFLEKVDDYSIYIGIENKFNNDTKKLIDLWSLIKEKESK